MTHDFPSEKIILISFALLRYYSGTMPAQEIAVSENTLATSPDRNKVDEKSPLGSGF
ncbi:MAG: hypothetical protein AAB845_00495 [Patescibacteria group bacterium]